jgi:anti-sigma regulatory factor (Ser/Thr protein kinase)
MRTAARQMPATWPLQTHLPLAALPTAPACARGHVRTVAHEWGLADLADIAELIVSELVTNAVQEAGRLRARAGQPAVPVVRLWVLSDRISLVMHVWDGSSEMPVRRDGAPDEEGGRGLMLVEHLSKGWGAYRKDSGKVVWAQIIGEP